MIDKFLAFLLGGMAKTQLFGTDEQRQHIEQSSHEVAQDDAFSEIKIITVKNGKHHLTGWHYVPAHTNGQYEGLTILFLSGSGGTSETYSRDFARFYCSQGAQLIAVNYRGYGNSYYFETDTSGQTTKHVVWIKDLNEDALNSDAHAMFDWIQQQIASDPIKIIVSGYSLGAPVATRLVMELAGSGIRVGGLVLHSAMDSIRDVVNRISGSFIGKIFADATNTKMNTASYLHALKEIARFAELPILLISGSGEQEHLGLDITKLDQIVRDAGFKCVYVAIGDGGHFDVAQHFGTTRSLVNDFMAEVMTQ